MNISKASSKLKLLSYALDADTRGYGNKKVFSLRPGKQITRGDSCNISYLYMSAHAGTHMDFPRHFFNAGGTVSKYRPEDLIFRAPCVIECAKKEDELVVPEDILPYDKRLKISDIVLLRTGFSKFRKERRYYTRNPGIAPEAAALIAGGYPNLRCVGIDSISVSAYQKRGLGRKTHKIFLGRRPPVLLLEDMNLNYNSRMLSRIKIIFAVPLLARDLEASPCCVLAYL